MTKFNFFSVIILILFSNISDVFSKNDTTTFDVEIYNKLSNETYSIKKIEIIGNKRTKRNIILRELSLKENETINKNEIINIVEEDKRKLINTNLFNEVDINIKILDENNLLIEIFLIESFYLLPSIIFELSHG